MKPDDKAKRLKIYISSTDKHEHSTLYETIVYSARKHGLSGATVLRGIMGYGASSEIHSNKFWEITEKIPVVIEIIDEPQKIDSFIEFIKPLFEDLGKGHIITVEETTILVHKSGKKV